MPDGSRPSRSSHRRPGHTTSCAASTPGKARQAPWSSGEPVNLLDLIIILAAIAYGIGGFRSGAVIGIFSLLGFFGGAAIGAQLAEPLGSRVVGGSAQVPVAIFCVL